MRDSEEEVEKDGKLYYSDDLVVEVRGSISIAEADMLLEDKRKTAELNLSSSQNTPLNVPKSFYPNMKEHARQTADITRLTKRINHYMNQADNHMLWHRDGLPPDPVPYRLWLEAGKYSPICPTAGGTRGWGMEGKRFNSCLWRNFRLQYDIETRTPSDCLASTVADMYPVTIPPPSKLGEASYVKFLEQSPMIKNERLRERLINEQLKTERTLRQLQLKSALRTPRVTSTGRAPHNRSQRSCDTNTNSRSTASLHAAEYDDYDYNCTLESVTNIDIFGRRVRKLEPPQQRTSKLTTKLNNPHYYKLR